jgi:hypothetical protein
MTNEEFVVRLKSLNLTKKTFAEKTNLAHRSVIDWSLENRRVPSWVESWLELYDKSLKYDELSSQIVRIPILKNRLD